ncbi:MAG: thioredoxin domain-containing protein [Leptospirillia bacterium]
MTDALDKNHLSGETSPYLLQHADNPVHWYPWGEEAIEKARAEGKPIFLSVGYSACHWCHVMAHESFEDEATAEIMNRHFVCIKVDREERPDIDHIYQSAYQLMAGRSGGWPLSMFITPELAPFWGGTYFPGTPRYGMPAFRDVLLGVSRHFGEKPEDAVQNGVALTQGLATLNTTQVSGMSFDDALTAQAAAMLVGAFDPVWGGFGAAPKFPSCGVLSLLLRRWYRSGDETCLHAVTHSLEKMAKGGIYDHLGGGFARYSVDEKWLVPHFEKMLYDNAQLVPLYLDAHRATGDPRFKQVVLETLGYVMREMTHPDGGFFAAQDADSEGEEGRFFVWTPEQIEAALGEDAALFMDCYGVTGEGNFEGRNILSLHEPLARVAARFSLSEEGAEARLNGARKKLLAVRNERVRPGRDDKIITAWNGLMIGAFAQAYEAFGDKAYLEAAIRAADFALSRLYAGGRLLRCWTAGEARHTAYLDDYAMLSQGLLELFRASGEQRWMKAAERLMDTLYAHFAAPQGGFYFTADDHETLPSRTYSGLDQSLPSGNGVAARCLARLYHLTGDARHLDAAGATVRAFLEPAMAQPLGYASILIAMDAVLHPDRVVALVGEAGDPVADEWRNILSGRYLPDVFVQRLTPGEATAPVLTGKGLVEGGAAAWVCTGGTCAPPAVDLAALETLLQGAGATS